LRHSVADSTKNGIIAEFKRASPSKGVINDHSTVAQVVTAYQQAGVSAVSVLTDSHFFKGGLDDLVAARAALNIPLLRKDFTIDAYQITEAKAYGADIILLIAAALKPEEVAGLSAFARSLGFEVLLEVHNEEELNANLFDTIDVIGVNNRDLKDFSVDINTSVMLSEKIPANYLKISESGLSDVDSIVYLREHGFNGFLIGENFMKTANPGIAMMEFVAEMELKLNLR